MTKDLQTDIKRRVRVTKTNRKLRAFNTSQVTYNPSFMVPLRKHS